MCVYMFVYVCGACSQNGFLTTQIILILCGTLRNIVSVTNIVIGDSLQIKTTLCTQRQHIIYQWTLIGTCTRILTNSIRAFVSPHKT